MPVTAEKPVTKDEYEERMALARTYGPHAVANLAAEFRRRYPVKAPTETGFDSVELKKCGLETATGGVEDAPLEKRQGKLRAKAQIAAHSGPPTSEEIAELLMLDAAPSEDFSGIVAEVLAGKTVAKSYIPTTAQIAQDDDLLINSAGI